MRLLFTATLFLFVGVSSLHAARSIEIRKQSARSRLIDIRFETSLSQVVDVLSIHLPKPVHMLIRDDIVIRYARRGVLPEEALRDIVVRSGYTFSEKEGAFEIRDPKEPVVTIDLQDAEVRVVLAELKRQCGIENLIVDRDVSGRGTFLLRDVPCSSAFRTVLNSFGLSGEVMRNSVMLVGSRK